MAANGITIVVVDDDDGHRELVRRSLRRAGIDNPLESLASGAEALDYVFCRGNYANRTPVDHMLMLLDINMPGYCDGVEVLRQIKADAKTRRIPVIMLTTADDPKEVDRCYDLGCNVYLTKPLEPSAFSKAIQLVANLLTVASTPTFDGRQLR
jgi:CheY-like chemotaxis protein